MKKSIKWRITIIFVLVMVCCLGSIFIFNTFFLEKYYINNRKEILKRTYVMLDEGVMNAFENGQTLKDLFANKNQGIKQKQLGPGFNSGDNFYDSIESSLSRFLREMQNVYNISIVLVDSENNTYSLYQNNQRFDRRIISYVFNKNETNSKINIIEKNNKYQISINSTNEPMKQKPSSKEEAMNDTKNSESNEEKTTTTLKKRIPVNSALECFGFLSDNTTAFLMTTPLVSLREPLEFFNKMLITVSLFIILIGSIIIYISSYRLTIPIKKLADLSKKMSKLDFDSKYEDTDRADEIGVLGKSMNDMSSKLEETIKELKNANIQLKSDIEQKVKLDNMRQEFIANVSHELKTPIALIQGYAEGLQCGMIENKEDRDFYLNVIIDESDKMNKMVRQLLNLSTLENKIDDIEIERINLSQIVNQVVKSQEILLKQKEIEVDTKIDDNIHVWADEFKLEEVIRNYLTNAINHVDDNKSIKIYIENLDNDKIRLDVYNSGVQLSDENLSNVWEKFYKTDKARTRSYGGTGLGLSIVKAIADKHHTQCGCINVDEGNGFYKGIKFYFDLHIK